MLNIIPYNIRYVQLFENTFCKIKFKISKIKFKISKIGLRLSWAKIILNFNTDQ